MALHPSQRKTIDDTTASSSRSYSSNKVSSEYYNTGDTAETTIADSDYFPFYDTSATGKRKSLWSNIKATLKTYFDTMYSNVKPVEKTQAQYDALTTEEKNDPTKQYFINDADIDAVNGIASITKTGTSGLVDTYTITFTNGNTMEYTVTNGSGNDIDAYHINSTTESDLADADTMPFYDSSASAAKNSTWSNIKAKLKAYFDTLYASVSSGGKWIGPVTVASNGASVTFTDSSILSTSTLELFSQNSSNNAVPYTNVSIVSGTSATFTFYTTLSESTDFKLWVR